VTLKHRESRFSRQHSGELSRILHVCFFFFFAASPFDSLIFWFGALKVKPALRVFMFEYRIFCFCLRLRFPLFACTSMCLHSCTEKQFFFLQISVSFARSIKSIKL